MGILSRQGVVLPAAAIAFLLASWHPSVAVAQSSCADVCVPNNTSPAPDSSCMVDCGECLATNTNSNSTGGCQNYFYPAWNSFDTLTTEEGIPLTYTNRYYSPSASVCLPLCSLSKMPWWGWLIFSIVLLLLIVSCGWCCYSCIQRRKRNIEAQRAVYEAQMAQGNPYPVAGYPYAYGQARP